MGPSDRYEFEDDIDSCSDSDEVRVEAKAKIRRLYDAGTPFFTRELLLELCQQLRAKDCDARGKKFYSKNLFGTSFEFVSETGKVESYNLLDSDASDDEDPKNYKLEESVYLRPAISYNAIQHILAGLKYNLDASSFGSLTFFNEIKRTNAKQGTRSLDEMRTRFDDSRKTWNESRACQQLHSLLQSVSKPTGINKIVIFSSGSMSYQGDQWDDEATQRTNAQLSLALTFKDYLKDQPGSSSLVCYAQEPRYTNDEKSILASLGIEVLEDPDGFLTIDESTMVLSFSSNVPVKQIVCDLSRPAMIIWENDNPGKTDEELFTQSLTDPWSTRVREMIRKDYNTHEFEGDPELFGDVKLFIRHTATTPSSLSSPSPTKPSSKI